MVWGVYTKQISRLILYGPYITSDKIKIKPAIDYTQNYHRECKEHMTRMITGKITKQTLCLSAKRKKNNQMSNEEMEEKYENITGHLA
jgi:hypothetical protein